MLFQFFVMIIQSKGQDTRSLELFFIIELNSGPKFNPSTSQIQIFQNEFYGVAVFLLIGSALDGGVKSLKSDACHDRSTRVLH